MNIFYLDRDPVKAAQQHYNKHVVKMILEAAQLLCTAHHLSGNPSDVPYKKTHMNHPSAIWVRSSRSNYLWCYEYMLALGAEYTRRYGKHHLTIAKCRDVLSKVPHAIHVVDFCDPPQCMPDEYKMADAVDGYKKYYEFGKAHLKDKV
jgi:hypothetical protein